MSLAAKLPYDHAYAGGYPGIGSQPLPTDADALDYLSRMATADGAGVETGVAVAVDAFFRDTKAAGVFSALKACCILCGARTITGALVPLVGTAPTAQGGWASGDYSRTAGMTGDGNALYLDANVANDSDFGGSVTDPQNDKHIAVFNTTHHTRNAVRSDIGLNGTGGSHLVTTPPSDPLPNRRFFRANYGSGNDLITDATSPSGLWAVSRASSASVSTAIGGNFGVLANPSATPLAGNLFVFCRSDPGANQAFSDATIAFYSIGTSLSLEDLDTAVTNLITAIGEAL
jgi:hypothetical protein